MKPHAPFSARTVVRRSGLTLIEIMIALTMTLIVLGAMMTAFQYASEQMQSGRALMELANRARSAESVLRSDLANVTVDVRPYAQTAAPSGYFEYIEGRLNDNSGLAGNILAGENFIDSYLGDVDDVLAMTVRSPDRPFRGRQAVITPGSPPTVGPANVIESSLAEVVWFTTWTDLDGDGTTINFDESIRIHRRALLIRPDLGVLLSDVNLAMVNLYIANNDISVRVVPKNPGLTLFDVVANNLADLAVRRNRFCHDPTAFPNNFDLSLAIARRGSQSEIMLTDATAFDIRVFSPNAPVKTDISSRCHRRTERIQDLCQRWCSSGRANWEPSSISRTGIARFRHLNLGFSRTSATGMVTLLPATSTTPGRRFMRAMGSIRMATV
jgi:type II secretory pathway pseudopilin PulG